MIFLQFLNHLNLLTRFANICPLSIRNKTSFSFSDVKICCKNVKFVTSVYRKPTFSGVSTKYESFIPAYQKRGLLHTLFHRSFSICCDFMTFHFEIDHLKTVLIKTITSSISQIRVLNHFLINQIYQKLWFRIYLKEMFF